MRVSVRLVWLPAIGVLLVGTVVLAAQGTPPPDGSMRELVAEVRALRQAVERTAAVTATLAIDLARTIAEIESLPAGADERGHLENAVKAMRARAKAEQDEAAQLRADEQDVLAALSGEQARWGDYNARLEAIEQEFAAAGARKP